jgi:hypothetical protein
MSPGLGESIEAFHLREEWNGRIRNPSCEKKGTGYFSKKKGTGYFIVFAFSQRWERWP